jgi:hypothetical protein
VPDIFQLSHNAHVSSSVPQEAVLGFFHQGVQEFAHSTILGVAETWNSRWVDFGIQIMQLTPPHEWLPGGFCVFVLFPCLSFSLSFLFSFFFLLQNVVNLSHFLRTDDRFRIRHLIEPVNIQKAM